MAGEPTATCPPAVAAATEDSTAAHLRAEHRTRWLELMARAAAAPRPVTVRMHDGCVSGNLRQAETSMWSVSPDCSSWAAPCGNFPLVDTFPSNAAMQAHLHHLPAGVHVGVTTNVPAV